MKLLAMLLALGIERLFTNLFELGELRWLDRYFDPWLRLIGRQHGLLGVPLVVLTVLIPVLPVIAVAVLFDEVLFGVVWLAFATVVLLFSLGPRDLGTEVDEFVIATLNEDHEAARTLSRELLETEPPHDRGRRALAIEEAIFVQSNNRTFGVILWFVLLGPAGAWFFRVTDLLRRRAFFEKGRGTDDDVVTQDFLTPVQHLHGVLAWLPSRLLAFSFALAGSFEPAVADWRAYYRDCSDRFFERNDEIVACAGRGALGAMEQAPAISARSAMGLVNRALVIWIVVIATLTVVGGML